GLLALLQIADSAFPSGAFSHSYGLEQLVREGMLKGPEAVEGYAAAVVLSGAATSDGRAAIGAAEAAANGDLETVAAWDPALQRTKAAGELRRASLAIGRRFLAEARRFDTSGLLGSYEELVVNQGDLGSHAVTFGLAGGTLGLPGQAVAAALLQGTAAN